MDFEPKSDVHLLEKAARSVSLPWDQWVIDGNNRWTNLSVRQPSKVHHPPEPAT